MPDSPLSESLKEAAELYCVPITREGGPFDPECIENLADDTEDPHTKAIDNLTAWYNRSHLDAYDRASCVDIDEVHHNMETEASDKGLEETALAIIGKNYYASKQGLSLIHSPECLR
jgi:hypothetical protein